jgi:deoxyribodipyrimidine photo-lyase
MAWAPGRAAGLAQLEAFTPRMGRAYSANRNTDLGPGRNDQVSGLSPWIRRRLVTEEAAVRAALEAHGPRGADKFVQEVLWRTYWKGWLEMRPEVWTRFEVERARLQAEGVADTDAVRAAQQGRTGIEGFDDWARELVETGWLHNHARMWFASIWVFTLGLPWVLGADFFLRHLLDGDPASNTLSWRWVAGVQTPGKTYLATAENIARFTEGRYRPRGLAAVATAVDEPPPPEARPLPPAAAATPDGPHLLLITAEDLTPEDTVGPWEICGAVSALEPEAGRFAAPATAFLEGAMADTEHRAGVRYRVPVRRLRALTGPGLVEASLAAGARGIVTPYAPVGPTASALVEAQAFIEAAGLHLVRVRRPWDEALWPQASRGFFPFRERAEPTLRTLGLPV